MSKFLTLMVALFASAAMFGVSISDAEAKRFGGGKSFGGKSGYSSPFSRSKASKPPGKQSAAQQKAAATNSAARANMSKRGGLMGALGALAIGGLLGALFFGGAFENLNFMDILVFAGIGFLIWKLMSSRRRSTGPAPAAAGMGGAMPRQEEADAGMYRQADPVQRESLPEQGSAPADGQHQNGRFNTDLMFGNDDRPSAPVADIPADFDHTEFLKGAKGAFELLQKSWNDKDLAGIREFTTDRMFGQIQDQYREEIDDIFVEVLKVDAELIEVRTIGDDYEATVMYDALLREDQDARPKQVREVWHFTRPINANAPTWFLDGIQQLED